MHTNPLNSVATALARDAHEELFESRRGVYAITDLPEPLVCLYNNNPYPDTRLREQETERIRQALVQMGLVERGYGAWPLKGEEAGYTYAMLIAASEADVERIVDVVKRSIWCPIHDAHA